MKFEIQPIGYVQSDYKEKFATPRQSGLVQSALGKICLTGPFNNPKIVEGLEGCSHIWLEFIFHQCIDQGWKPRVRPPRLGGNERMGVFATRATHRPNALGLSAVKLESISVQDEDVVLAVSGLDLVDGTPIIDIKPYIPYSDCIPEAQYDFAQQAPAKTNVFFDLQQKETLSDTDKSFIEDVIAYDPRPAFHKIDPTRTYGAKLRNFNVVWRYQVSPEETVEIVVTQVSRL